MEIYALGSTGSILKKLKCINIQWTRRYYAPGEYSIQIPASEYTEETVWIWSSSRNELGIIQKIEYTDTYSGQIVQLSGYFYEFSLTDTIIYPKTSLTGTAGYIANQLYGGGESGNVNMGTEISVEELGGELSTRLYSILKTQELSYRFNFDFALFSATFEVWQGLDRTEEQSENTFATFSENLHNIENISVNYDTSNYKNYCIVGGGEDQEPDIFVIVDESDGNAQKQLYITSAETYDTTTQTLAEYQEILRQEGLEALASYKIVNSVTCDVSGSSLVYMTDYDLGDKCEIVIDSLQLSYSARIIEIYEVVKNNVHTVTLTFGEKTPTIYEKARI